MASFDQNCTEKNRDFVEFKARERRRSASCRQSVKFIRSFARSLTRSLLRTFTHGYLTLSCSENYSSQPICLPYFSSCRACGMQWDLVQKSTIDVDER